MFQSKVKSRKQIKLVNNKGFSLVEVIVAMVLLSIIAISTMLIFERMQSTNQKSNEYQGGLSFGNSLLDSLETLSYADILNKTQDESGMHYDAKVIEQKLRPLVDFNEIENYLVEEEKRVTFHVKSDDYDADVEVKENNNSINTVSFPSIDALNAEETYVLNLGNVKASGLNTYDGTKYDEEAAQWYLAKNEEYIASLAGDEDFYGTSLTREELYENVARMVTISLDYVDGYTTVKGQLSYKFDEDVNNAYAYLAEDNLDYTIDIPLHQQMLKNLYLVYGLTEYRSDKIDFVVSKSYVEDKQKLKLFIMAQNSSYITGKVDELSIEADNDYNAKLKDNGISYISENGDTVQECVTVFSNSTVIKNLVVNRYLGFQYTKDGNYTREDGTISPYDVKKDVKLFDITVKVYDKNGTNVYSKSGTSILK